MKKRFKGFTLIECLVALGILGIASLTMAQIYATVAMRNRMNHLVNTSLSNQMAYVERYTNSEAVPIYFGTGKTDKADKVGSSASATGQPPHVLTSTGAFNYVITKFDPSAAPGAANPLDAKQKYSYPADIYVLHSRDRGDVKLNDGESDMGYTEENYNLRYKYVIGHSGT